MDVVIRPADVTEAAAIQACAAAAFSHYIQAIGRRPAPMDQDPAPHIAAGEVWVAGDEAQILGYAIVLNRGGHAVLDALAVDPCATGRGLGRRLIAAAEDHARAQGLTVMRLCSNQKMTRNIGYYPRLGYAEIGRGVEDGYHRVFFEKRLT